MFRKTVGLNINLQYLFILHSIQFGNNETRRCKHDPPPLFPLYFNKNATMSTTLYPINFSDRKVAKLSIQHYTSAL